MFLKVTLLVPPAISVMKVTVQLGSVTSIPQLASNVLRTNCIATGLYSGKPQGKAGAGGGGGSATPKKGGSRRGLAVVAGRGKAWQNGSGPHHDKTTVARSCTSLQQGEIRQSSCSLLQ